MENKEQLEASFERSVTQRGKTVGTTALSDRQQIIDQIVANNTPSHATRQERRRIRRIIEKKMRGIQIV